MVIPVGPEKGAQTIKLIKKDADGKLKQSKLEEVVSPLLALKLSSFRGSFPCWIKSNRCGTDPNSDNVRLRHDKNMSA